MRKKKQNNPDTNLETALLKKGYKFIVGIDEAGRGSWAGPVTVGAYMFSLETKVFTGVKDSKLLSPKQREILYKKIFDPKSCFVEFGNVDQINKFGISTTITILIKKIISKTYQEDVFYIIDGVFKNVFCKNSMKIIKGDLKHYSISCASILAKVTRDRHMIKLSKQFPNYYLESNKGYGTKKHQDALQNYGISKIHRLNYKPIALLYKSNVKSYSEQTT